jgi:hypothetical protein
MRPGNGKGVVLWVGIGLMLALVSLTGCVRVEVIDTTPVASTPNSPTTPSAGVSPSAEGGGDHNLAVLTVDFDRPLSDAGCQYSKHCPWHGPSRTLFPLR